MKTKIILMTALLMIVVGGCKKNPPEDLVTVRFLMGDNTEFQGGLPPSLTISKGTVLSENHLTPLRDTNNFHFIGWYDGSTKVRPGEYKVTKDLSLEAKWYYKKALTFRSPSDQTFRIEKTFPAEIPESFEYSLDRGGSWESLGDKTVKFGGETILYVRGKSSYGTATSDVEYLTFKFGTEASVECRGDIRTLIDYTQPESVETSDASFRYLFYECTVLTVAPTLPLAKFADYAYEFLFGGCLNLVEGPEELPAPTLTEGCYSDMFYNCQKLLRAPVIKAKTTAKDCCYNMFKQCKSITKAPELLPSEMSENCYAHMFEGCDKLTTVPPLRAAVVKNYCYGGLFIDCPQLKEVVMLATSIDNFVSLSSWLYNTKTNGTLYVANETMKSNESITDNLPEGWKIEVYQGK